jgi:hypothetical protein
MMKKGLIGIEGGEGSYRKAKSSRRIKLTVNDCNCFAIRMKKKTSSATTVSTSTLLWRSTALPDDRPSLSFERGVARENSRRNMLEHLRSATT